MLQHTELNQKLLKELEQRILVGATRKDLIAYIGMPTQAFNDVLEKGRIDLENGEKSFEADVFKTINNAEHEFKCRQVEKIVHQAQGDWKAAAWLLAHYYPDEFSEFAISHRLAQTERSVPAVAVEFVDATEANIQLKELEQTIENALLEEKKK